MDAWSAILLTIVTAATPLLLAAIGELVVERSGVLNLGVEGMMVMGAVAGFGAAFVSGNPYLGAIAAIVAGMAMALLFGFLTLTLVSNQVFPPPIPPWISDSRFMSGRWVFPGARSSALLIVMSTAVPLWAVNRPATCQPFTSQPRMPSWRQGRP